MIRAKPKKWWSASHRRRAKKVQKVLNWYIDKFLKEVVEVKYGNRI